MSPGYVLFLLKPGHAMGQHVVDSAVSSRPAFVIDGQAVTWEAVVADARRTGVWRTVEVTTREGLACLAADLAAGQAPSQAKVRAAAARWRTRRRLTAAEDMEAWLAGWGLDERAFFDHIRRTLARDAHQDDAAQVARDTPVKYDLVGRAWTTAVCSGAMERAARTLAERLAVRARMVEEGRAEESEDLDTVCARFRERVVTPAALQEVVQARQLDWTRVVGDVLVFGGRDAALEGRLCLLDDGATPAELAAEHGVERHHQTWFVADVPEADQPAVLGASSGDVIGPLERDTGWTLMAVTGRIAASLDDATVRARAEQEVIARAVSHEVDERVVWTSGLWGTGPVPANGSTALR